ncbi:MAG: aconitase family protein, partial [Myxococcota bacterium]
MNDIDPIALGELYARMTHASDVVRRRTGRPLGLADKLLLGHLVDPEGADLGPGAELSLRADRVVLQDVLGQTAFLQFEQTGRPRVALPVTVHCDHLIRARVGAAPDLADALADNGEVYRFLRSAAARFGAGFWEPGAGIVHQVVLENHAVPGALILGTDSHTPNAGGLGACAVGVGGGDAVEVMAGLPWTVPNPRRIAVVLEGALSGWASPKDVILWVAGQLSVSGATHAVLEYLGPGVQTLSATGRATIANMGAEVGATTSLFPWSPSVGRYLAATGRAALVPVVDAHRALLSPDPEVEAAPERTYDRVLRLDLSALEPHVSGPHSPDRARPLSQLAGEVAANGWTDRLSAALIGSCTNASYEDIARASEVARAAADRGVRARSELWFTPGSDAIRATVDRDGWLAPLEAVGAVRLASACGPCIGQWERSGAPGGADSIVTSFNRNFAGRNDGRPTTAAFVASPEIVVALALAGRLSFDPAVDTLLDRDGRPFRLPPPGPVPDVPPAGLVDRTGYCPPPDDGAAVPLALDPDSVRLQRLPRWPAWDGRDLVGCPVLLKAVGKTTTDQISPAGAWLRLRGHLERFSDNLLSGAIDAGTGERGV